MYNTFSIFSLLGLGGDTKNGKKQDELSKLDDVGNNDEADADENNSDIKQK